MAKAKKEDKKPAAAKRNLGKELLGSAKAVKAVKEGKAKVQVHTVVKKDGKPVAKIAAVVPKTAPAKKPKVVEVKSQPVKKAAVKQAAATLKQVEKPVAVKVPAVKVKVIEKKAAPKKAAAPTKPVVDPTAKVRRSFSEKAKAIAEA